MELFGKRINVLKSLKSLLKVSNCFLYSVDELFVEKNYLEGR